MASAYEHLFPIQRQASLSKQQEAARGAPQWNEQTPLRRAAGA